MMLEQLIEKKDLRLYIKLRLAILMEERKALAERVKDDKLSIKKSKVINRKQVQAVGRGMELKRLLYYLDSIKRESKKMWPEAGHLIDNDRKPE